jgi:hypothetical protein
MATLLKLSSEPNLTFKINMYQINNMCQCLLTDKKSNYKQVEIHHGIIFEKVN